MQSFVKNEARRLPAAVPLCREEGDWVEAGQRTLATAQAVSCAPDSETRSEANQWKEKRQATFAEPPRPKSMPWLSHRTPDTAQEGNEEASDRTRERDGKKKVRKRDYKELMIVTNKVKLLK
jgi:hypothetical protein